MTEPTGARLALTMHDDTGSEVTLLSPYLGMRPYVLIEMDIEDDELVYAVNTGGGVPTDPAEVVEVFEAMAEMFRQAAAQRSADQTPEETE